MLKIEFTPSLIDKTKIEGLITVWSADTFHSFAALGSCKVIIVEGQSIVFLPHANEALPDCWNEALAQYVSEMVRIYYDGVMKRNSHKWIL